MPALLLEEEDGGWGRAGADLTVTIPVRSGESLQRGSVSRRKRNQNAKWNCSWFLRLPCSALRAPLCFPNSTSGRGRDWASSSVVYTQYQARVHGPFLFTFPPSLRGVCL